MTTADREGAAARWLAPLLLIAAVAAVYSTSFGGHFVFDDLPNIVDNPSIRSLRPLTDTLWPPPDNIGVAGRPLVNLSLAVNWAISADDPWSYHALNLLIHALAALTLYGVVRQSLTGALLADRYRHDSTVLALAVALLWAVHPLQTQAVTYVIQRCESLMGLFFLLTLYCAIRGWRQGSWRGWHGLAVASCLLGVGCKETIAVAPVLVLLYELIFEGRGPIDALRRSRSLYLGFGLCLVVLAVLVFTGGTAGSIPRGELLPWGSYLLTQAEVTVHYLGLALWPASLCLDYGWPPATAASALPYALVVALLATLTLVGIGRRDPWGYLGAWFFGTLAPAAVVPFPDIAFEHRMYLPLAAVVSGMVFGLHRLANRLPSRKAATTGAVALLAVAALSLGLRSAVRNLDYRDPLLLWGKNVDARPDNPRPLTNLANELVRRGAVSDGVGLYRRAIAVAPSYALAHRNLALLMQDLGRSEKALEHFHEAVRLRPWEAGWRNELALYLSSLGLAEQAIPHYQEAIRLRPEEPATAPLHHNLGAALEALGRNEEAMASYRRALKLDPGHEPSRQRLQQLEAEPPPG